MSVSGKTGVQVLVKHKQASDVSLAVSFEGVVYLLEVGSLTTVIRFSWLLLLETSFLIRFAQIKYVCSIGCVYVNNDIYGILFQEVV